MPCALLHYASRLNLGVRRQRAFGKCIVGAATFRLRSALLFGRFVGMSLLRLRPQCALTIRMRRVAWLRKQRSSSASFPYLAGGFGHGRLIVCGARSIIRSSVFGQLVRSSASPASGPPNKSFKPTPCRGVCHVLYATLAHVRRPATGRLNSGVRRQKNIHFQLRFACSAAPLISAPLPSLAAALNPFGSHAALRTVRLARSKFTSVAFARFGNSGWCGLCSATDTVASETPG